MDNLIFVVSSDKNINSNLSEYLKELEYTNIQFFDNEIDGIEKYEKNSFSIIYNIQDDLSIECDKISQLKNFTNKIIVILSDCSTDNLIRLMRIGMMEIIPNPVLKVDLAYSLKALENVKDNIIEKDSKIISVYSNKGGIGKTTIATNLAYELSRISTGKVALIDLNLQLGDVSTFLNLKPTFDVSYVAKHIANKNDDTILDMFEKYNQSDLYVLSDPMYIEHANNITTQQIDLLFKKLRKIFQFIIIDMSSSIEQNTLKILDSSDIILFTSIVNLPAMRNLQRCLNLFTSRKYDKNKIKIVLNRYIENDVITIEDIENTLGQKIYWKIPNNYFSIIEAINKGMVASEVNSNSNIANNFQDFATKIVDDVVQQLISTGDKNEKYI